MKIGIDLDEVTNEFVKIFLDYYNHKNKTHFKFDEMTNPLFWNHLGLSSEEFFKEFDSFEKEYKIEDYPLIKDAKTVIHELSKENSIYFITSRKESKRAETLNFLNKHFGDIEFDLIIVSNRVNENKGLTKAQTCAKEGIMVIIEDGPSWQNSALKRGFQSCFLINHGIRINLRIVIKTSKELKIGNKLLKKLRSIMNHSKLHTFYNLFYFY